jgi:uncharacterized OsmC-like protein
LTSEITSNINDVPVDKLIAARERARLAPASADRDPRLVARWVGGGRSRVEFGEEVTHIGGEADLNPMQMLLATLAACDVDLIALHASLLGLEIESLSVEAAGHFNVRSYFGIEDAPSCGYEAIEYTVRLSVPGATPEQIAYLQERCKRSSPVGDSLERVVPLKMIFEANP